MIAFAIQLAFFLIFVVWHWLTGDQVRPNLVVLLLPVLILMMALFSLALGIIVSALTTRYRDLAVVLTFGVQLYMYLTPIVFPVSNLPERWQWWIMANPLAPIVEAFRYGMFGAGTFDPWALTASAITIVVVLIAGVALFNRVERTFMDTV